MGATAMTVDPLTNRMTSAGHLYDVNGNVTQTPDAQKDGYDVANRLTSRGAIYVPQNRRCGRLYLNLYSVSGQFGGKYQPVWRISFSATRRYPNTYFNGRLVLEAGVPVMTDRLGSVRVSGRCQRICVRTRPRRPATNGRNSERTRGIRRLWIMRITILLQYERPLPDANTFQRSHPADPGSRNKYAYVGGDPVNFNDPPRPTLRWSSPAIPVARTGCGTPR